MAFWIELHCDAREWATTKVGAPACVTTRGEQPGVLVHNTQEAVVSGIRYLRARAKDIGWIQSEGAWICSVCQKIRAGTYKG